MTETTMIDVKNELFNELKYIARKMEGEIYLNQKIFYFSEAYKAADRALRLKYSRELLSINQILQLAHSQIAARADAFGGENQSIPITYEMTHDLCGLIETLAGQISNGENPHPTLERITELAYKTTPEGYYVTERETIKD